MTDRYLEKVQAFTQITVLVGQLPNETTYNTLWTEKKNPCVKVTLKSPGRSKDYSLKEK